MQQSSRIRLIAFYLPQFHPIPENDAWWGKGFTEWTNVSRARPLFKGHYQPRIPADLGFYDLRLAEVWEAQAELASRAGIEGFCYWHYWFAGRRLLERPVAEMLRTGRPEFPFCLGWANETWTGVWYGASNRVLMEQTYPGQQDHEAHFQAVLPAFRDPRYLRVLGKPIFVIYRPHLIPSISEFMKLWRRWATDAGLAGIHFVANLSAVHNSFNHVREGFDGWTYSNVAHIARLSVEERLALAGEKDGHRWVSWAAKVQAGLSRKISTAQKRVLKHPTHVYSYKEAILAFERAAQYFQGAYPCIAPNWDNSPRSGRNAVILHRSTPELFREHVHRVLRLAAPFAPENRLVFVKSWNEWAEGNYLEPDMKFGCAYLDVLREELTNSAAVVD